MFLVITEPHSGDYGEFFDLVQDQDIQSEFLNFKDINLFEVIEHVNHWIEVNNDSSANQLRLIKIGVEQKEVYTKEDSELIGFISISPTGPVDQAITGCNHLLHFAIKKKYRNQNLMTQALNLRLQRLKDLGFNLIYSLVKAGNYPSRRVLEKCGFAMIDEVPTGYLYCYRFR